MSTGKAAVQARLEFAVAGGRTSLMRQHVPYPFHITRPFYLDAERPDLATLYLQSASGGLYSGEQLNLSVTVNQRAAVAMTTQSATIVHDGRGQPATQKVHLSLAAGSLMIFSPDPLVLFPNAAIRTALDVVLGHDAVAVCQDGFACHDPNGGDAVFEHLSTEITVRSTDGRVYVTERCFIPGQTLGGMSSPLGPYRAAGSVLLLGLQLSVGKMLQGGIDELGCLSGISALPNGIGTAIRLLAPDGYRLSKGLRLAFDICFQAAAGVKAAPRRK